MLIKSCLFVSERAIGAYSLLIQQVRCWRLKLAAACGSHLIRLLILLAASAAAAAAAAVVGAVASSRHL